MRRSEVAREEKSERALDIVAVRERYRHFRSIRHGYVGLGLFLVFMFAYVCVLGAQHRASTVGDANDSFQTQFELMKSDLKSSDSATLWKFISGTVVSKLLGTSWTNTTSGGMHLAGRTSNGYFHVLGGLILTAKKGPVHACFHGQPCFDSDKITEPFYPVQLAGENAPFSVPYRADVGGYSVCLPSGTSEVNIQKLLKSYAGLFGPDTREIWVHAAVFNPNEFKTVTSLAIGATVTVRNKLKMYTKITTIPYHFYEPDRKTVQMICEVFICVFALWAFVMPLLRYALCEPKSPPMIETLQDMNLRQRWLSWSQGWSHLPARGGQLLWGVPTTLYIAYFAAFGYWFFLGYQYSGMASFGADRLDWAFVDPLSQSGSDHSMMAAAMAAMHKNIWPVIHEVDTISGSYNLYFFMHVVVMSLMVMRLQQYLAFQKRLAIVTDTFSGIFDDLLHIGIVLMLVCFFFGVINSLAFGAYDPAFQNFLPAFCEMVLCCFGMFRPAAGTPFIQSMFKYSPHIINVTEFVTWVPVVLQILFKTVVILLIFKLLMGVIMEGYKKHAKLKEHASTVREDLYYLALGLHHYLWGHWIMRRSYVPFFHVALALAQIKATEDRPWEEHFLGLDGEETVKEALNGVFGIESPAVQAQIKHHNLSECDQGEVDFVLNAYGINRERAVDLFDKIWIAQQKQQSKEKKPRDEEEAIADKMDTDAETSLKVVHKKLHAARSQQKAGDVDEFSHTAKKGLSEAEVADVFKEYDILGLGTVDHRLMPQLFRQLGFDVRGRDLADLLAAYDHNEDRDSDLKEFIEIVHDNSLIGLWKSRPKRSTFFQDPHANNRQSGRKPNNASLVANAVYLQPAATPLLQA